ncbi:FAD:protein FMN transferase [Chloroherpeton thalassium]|nr:FAD:protein FMN transferase [Chloroherpeton thalassium]
MYEQEKILMGTLFKIKAYYNTKDFSRAQLDSIAALSFAEVDRLEQDMSEWKPESPISMAATFSGEKPVKITPEIREVVDMALAISERTSGAFDISFKPLGQLWNVKQRTVPPTKAEIDSAAKLVNFKNIVLQPDSLTLFLKQKGMRIGLGGIAKGYAAKKAGEVLENAGIENYILNAGGDLYFSGSKNGTLWTSGIKDPDGESAPVMTFEIRKKLGIATSGDYENFFMYQGEKYHHIIDLRTGFPAKGLKSVTVFSEDPTLADAYATAFFILGYKPALQIVKQLPGLAFVMIDTENQILKSPNVAEFISEFE